jgi:hypothetical protein
VSDPREVNANLFKDRLREALAVARRGNTAIVIVPHGYPHSDALAYLGQQLNPITETHARASADALYFEGTRGSVRIYPVTHITYDHKQKRLLDYPAGVQTFLHPEVEGL